jgi:hypothetical protein
MLLSTETEFKQSFCDPDMDGCLTSPICGLNTSKFFDRSYQIDSDWEYDGGTCNSIDIRPKHGTPSANHANVNILDGSKKIVRGGKTLWNVTSRPTALTYGIIGITAVILVVIVKKGIL